MPTAGLRQSSRTSAKGLIDRGHDVVVIGAGESRTGARFFPTYSEPPSTRLGEPVPEVLHAAMAQQLLRKLDVDVVHDHSLAGPLTAAARSVPTVVTAHGPVDGEFATYYQQLGDTVHLVACSEAQRCHAPHLNWAGRVHPAVDVGSYPYRQDKEGFVLFLGRFDPRKGAHLAIDIAREAGRPILLAGKLNETAEREYFDREIKPRLGANAEYVGVADWQVKRELLSAARCLMFPIQWEEPFGIVMVEALACGTPVVATSRGAVPEIIKDGVTGEIRERTDDLAAAVNIVHNISPAACRADALENFDASKMAALYAQLYDRVRTARIDDTATSQNMSRLWVMSAQSCRNSDWMYKGQTSTAQRLGFTSRRLVE